MDLEFIEYDDPTKASTVSKQHAVKSKAARHHWARDAEARAARRSRGNRSNPAPSQTFEINIISAKQATTAPGISINITNVAPTPTPSPQDILGAGRIDPFQTYPVSFELYFPEVVDHYVTEMAVPIPEIDGPGAHGLLRTKWFPLVMCSSPLFLTVMLLAASHLYSVQKTPNVAADLLHLKERAFRAINECLSSDDPGLARSDAIVGAVAKMCSYEAMYGDTESYEVHMRGLLQLVERRGGLGALGLEGMLRRICVWVDLNSAHLNKTERFFPGEYLVSDAEAVGEADEPNPGQFVGSWD